MLKSHAEGGFGTPIVDVSVSCLVAIAEGVELCVEADEIAAPLVGDGGTGIEVDAHTTITVLSSIGFERKVVLCEQIGMIPIILVGFAVVQIFLIFGNVLVEPFDILCLRSIVVPDILQIVFWHPKFLVFHIVLVVIVREGKGLS